ncbi:MAG: helix-turn-helix transcriptional regulator [Acidimicrobiia bacterium]|nr:helix-turn-helix transcriptional regulator [Acidimicrobiia bacterium]
MARRSRPAQRPTWTPNQIVAFNLSKARLLRGWTQTQAAEALEPYLGTRLSPASWSAMERSVDGGRIREITADELVAFARGFELPVGFFLTPPSAWENHAVRTPDTGEHGLEPIELFDHIIGTDESLAEWEQYLKSWPAPGHTITIAPDGTVANSRRIQEDVHPRLAGPAALRARLLIQQQFGDLDAARRVLERLATALDQLGDPETEPQ